MSADTGEPAVGIDWSTAFAARTRRRSAEVAAILAGTPPGVLSMTGGFPNPATFPTDVVDELAARILRDDASALQYTPSEGIPSVRDYLIERQEQLQGRAAGACRADRHQRRHGVHRAGLPGADRSRRHDRGRGADLPRRADGLRAASRPTLDAIPMDDDGLRRRRARRAARSRAAAEVPLHDPRVPEPDRPHAAARAAAGAGRAVPPPWRADPRGRRLPRDRVRRRAACRRCGRSHRTSSSRPARSRRSSRPGVRLGWAVGPRDVLAQMAAAKQTTDQCSSGFGQRIVEEYGRAGGFERQLPRSRELYASPLAGARDGAPPARARWLQLDEPGGGFFAWLTLPASLDATALRPAAPSRPA